MLSYRIALFYKWGQESLDIKVYLITSVVDDWAWMNSVSQLIPMFFLLYHILTKVPQLPFEAYMNLWVRSECIIYSQFS